MKEKETWVDVLRRNEEAARERLKDAVMEDLKDFYDMTSETE